MCSLIIENSHELRKRLDNETSIKWTIVGDSILDPNLADYLNLTLRDNYVLGLHEPAPNCDDETFIAECKRLCPKKLKLSEVWTVCSEAFRDRLWAAGFDTGFITGYEDVVFLDFDGPANIVEVSNDEFLKLTIEHPKTKVSNDEFLKLAIEHFKPEVNVPHEPVFSPTISNIAAKVRDIHGVVYVDIYDAPGLCTIKVEGGDRSEIESFLDKNMPLGAGYELIHIHKQYKLSEVCTSNNPEIVRRIHEETGAKIFVGHDNGFIGSSLEFAPLSTSRTKGGFTLIPNDEYLELVKKEFPKKEPVANEQFKCSINGFEIVRLSTIEYKFDYPSETQFPNYTANKYLYSNYFSKK